MPFSPSLPSLLLFATFLSLATSQSSPPRCDEFRSNCRREINQIREDERIQIKYANKTIPKVEYSNNYVDVDVSSDNDLFKYRFAVCGCDVTSKDRQVIDISPLEIFIQEGPILALFALLAPNDLNFIKAVLGKDFIFNKEIRANIDNDITKEVGNEGVIDYSKLREVNPFLSIIGTFTVDSYREANLGIPFLVAAENQEQSPLARAEWMKLIGLVLGRPKEASKKFEEIEKRYNEAKKKASEAVRRPAVFFNHPVLPIGGNRSAPTVDERYKWTQPVEDEYIVQLVSDANADYRYIDEDPVPGETGNQFNMSMIVRDFASADYLILSSNFPGSSDRTLGQYLDQMVVSSEPDADAKEEMEKLRAVRCASVWSHQKRVTDDGKADDYFESATFKPDEVLLDVIQALHPYLDFDKRETEYLYRYEESGIDPQLDCPFTDLSGEAREGFVFIDKKFSVANLDRFEIADRLENKVLPSIRKRINERFEVFFHHEDVSESETYVTVRVEVSSAQNETFKDSDVVALGMTEALGSEVAELNEDGSKKEPPKVDEGGGLSGGAIAGIVIAVIIAVAVIGGAVWMKRSRSGTPAYAGQVAPQSGDYWDGPDETGTRHEGPGVFP